jgi:type VI protein secretion system component VasK
MIPTFVQQVIGAVVRAVIIWLAAYVAAHGGPSYADDQIGKIVAEATPVVLVVLWSIYQKYKSRQKLMFALASTAPTSENHVDAAMSSTQHQPPSVMTPPHEVPTVTPNSK